MNLETKSAKQLGKMLKRLNPLQSHSVAMEWASRIERGPVRCAFPKKRQRAAGLLPKVQ